MKTNRKNQLQRYSKSQVSKIMALAFLFLPALITAQQGHTITGEIRCRANDNAVAFANVALLDTTLTRIIDGAACNENGIFNMKNVSPGSYMIQVSALGFEAFVSKVQLKSSDLVMGAIGMAQKNLELQDVEVVAERIKAKQAAGNITYFVNAKMQGSSNTGTDILKLIPGVQVDLQQNVSLEGSGNIIILVDGKERDRSYLSQLPAAKVDKIEVITSPASKYDASVTGVINIVLAREKNTGADGHLHLEIPTSESEVLLAPSYSLNYGFKKINLSTSYTGDFRRFKITESFNREVYNHAGPYTLVSTQLLTQKTWSHRFHYGLDWYINKHNQLNFYGFYNPYSQELDGSAEVHKTGPAERMWQAEKEDDDINRSLFYSLWFRHLFDETPGHDITLEMSLHNLKATNSTTFSNAATGYFVENKFRPDNRSVYLKLDYNLPAGDHIKLNAGGQARLRILRDRNQDAFGYDENIYAGYGTFSYSRTKLEINMGMRLEYAGMNGDSREKTSALYLLPQGTVKYNLSSKGNLLLNYRRSLQYPGFYQLNSLTAVEDPFTVTSGNPNLQSEIHNRVYLEYSHRFENHFFSARLYSQRVSSAIRNLMAINEEGFFDIRKSNTGEIRQNGLQISAALGFGKVGINPFVKVFEVYSIPNRQVSEYNLKPKHLLAAETGVSAYGTFGNDYTASFTFQYNSPLTEMQSTSFSDALYFISFEKSFSKGLKAGIVSGAPFTRSFTYQGSEVFSGAFSHTSKGELHLSLIPIWLKVSYRFSSGHQRQKIDRVKSDPVREIRKGF
jgi:outer membrane cobalamin receptor